MVVNEELSLFLWVVEGLKPLKELGEEGSGLLDKNPYQNERQLPILHSTRQIET